MKKIIIALLAVVALYGCKGVSYDIKGMAVNMPGQVTLVSAHDYADTLAVCDVVYDTGYFEFKGKVDKPQAAIVCDPDGVPLVLVFLEKGEIKINLNEDQNAYYAAGTPSNDGFNEVNYRIWDMQMNYNNLAHEGAADEELEAVLEEYNTYILSVIEENSNRLLGAYFFQMMSENMSVAEITEGLEKLSWKMRNTEMIKQVAKRVESMKHSEIGADYIDIVANDIDGNPVALSSLVGDGKWVLVDFWATWCGPCRGEIPNLMKVYKNYADKGLEIYSISLDNDIEAWKGFVTSNELAWVNVYGLNEQKACPAAEDYNVRAIPATFLISPEGKIVAKNLTGEELNQKLVEVFGE